MDSGGPSADGGGPSADGGGPSADGGSSSDAGSVACTSATTSWLKVEGGSDWDEAVAVGVDLFGYVYVAGNYGAGAKIGSFSLPNTGAFVARYAPSGTLLWAKTIENAQINDLAAGSSGGATVVGTIFNQVTIGSKTLTPTGPAEAFIAQLSMDGAYGESRVTSTTGNFGSYGEHVTRSNFGSAFFSGRFSGQMTVQNTTGSKSISAAADKTSGFVADIDFPNGGNVVEMVAITGDWIVDTGVALDWNGQHLYAFGTFQGQATLPSPPAGPSIVLNATGGLSDEEFYVGKMIWGASGPLSFSWAKSGGGSGWDFARAAAIDTWGNVWLMGASTGAGTFDGKAIPTGGFITRLYNNGFVEWVSPFNGVSEGWGGIALDPKALAEVPYAYVAGRTGGFGLGFADIIFSQFDKKGNEVFSTTAGGGDFDGAADIALAPDLSPVIVGGFGGNAGTIGTFANSTAQALGGTDVLAWKINSCVPGSPPPADATVPLPDLQQPAVDAGSSPLTDGPVAADAGTVSIFPIQAGDVDLDVALDIARDSQDNLVIVGYYHDTISFEQTSLTSAGAGDAFVAKYDKYGHLIWALSAGGPAEDQAHSVAIDSSDNIVVTGFFQGTAQFGTKSVTAAGSPDVFVAKLSPAGDVQWVKAAGGAGQDLGRGIAAAADGTIAVTGFSSGTASFGGQTATSTNGGPDMFVAKYTSTGDVLWVKTGGGQTQGDSGEGVAVHSNGDIVVTGSFTDKATFSGVPLSGYVTDVFVARYASTGQLLWVTPAGGSGQDTANDVALDASGNAYITGFFGGQQIFGSSALFGSTMLSSLGGNADVFVAKIDTAGQFVWAVGGGGAGWDEANAIALRKNGEIVISGHYRLVSGGGSNSLTFGTNKLSYNSSIDTILVAKVSPTGQFTWATSAYGVGSAYGLGVAISSADAAFVTGGFEGMVNLGGKSLSVADYGYMDVYIWNVAVP
jgi:hypothetical protein